MRVARILAVGPLLLVPAAACSLDEGQTGTSSGGDGGDAAALDVVTANDVTVGDAPFSSDAISVDVLGDAPPADAGPCTTPMSACAALPGGWNPVAFVENPSNTCPAGWTTRTGIEKPVAGPSACACGCSSKNPTCDNANLATNISNSPQCANGAKTLNGASSACKSIGSTNLDNYMQVPPIALSGGSCTVVVNPNSADITATPVRECDPTPACKGDVCSGIAPTTYAACIEKGGNQSCPGGYPTRYLVGDAVSPQCGNGTCACGATPACSAPTLSLYSDNGCATKVLDTPADNNCNATNLGSNVSFQSYKYLSTPSIACAASGAAVANPTVAANVRTACCK